MMVICIFILAGDRGYVTVFNNNRVTAMNQVQSNIKSTGFIPKKAVATQIDIDARPETLWQVLTNFSKYADWSPTIRKAEGEFRVGEKLKFTALKDLDSSEIVQVPATVLTIEPNRKLVWGASLPLLFKGAHSFTIEPTAQGCLFKNSETYEGLIVPLVMTRTLMDKQQRGFEAFNLAFKARCEWLALK